jgi:hypothetical protein
VGFEDATWGLCEGTAYPFLTWVLDSPAALDVLGGLEVYAPCAVVDGRSGNAALRSLSLVGGSLSPAFDADVVSYAVTLAARVDVVTVLVAADDPAARVSVNGSGVGSGGSLSVPVRDDGTLVVSMVVTAEDGSERRYVLSASRNAGEGPFVEEAGSGVLIVPDDGSAWVVFMPVHGLVDNYEVRVDGGAWRPYEPVVTEGPLFVGPLVNGREAVIAVRAVVDGVPTESSASYVVVPEGPRAPDASVGLMDAAAEVEVLAVAAGRATIRVAAS